MKKWWIGFAIAIPVSYMFGMHLAHSASCGDSSTRWSCIVNKLRIDELKSVSCKIFYKAMYDDLKNKEMLHKGGIYRMPAMETIKYENLVNEYMNMCVPEDPEVDRIEKNEGPVEVTHT